MSFPELLAAALALPTAEKLQLMHALEEDVGTAPRPNGGLTEEEVEFLKRHAPPGAVFEIHTPLECYGAAAELERLLKERTDS